MDWLAVLAVFSELVSARKFPVNREPTGIFANSRADFTAR